MKVRKIPMESLIQVILLQLETAGAADLTVTGNSMRPMLRPYHDMVRLKPVDGMLQPGDIALYRRDNGQYILHRVIRLTTDGYLFCGDNQDELEPVRHDQMVALVVGYEKSGKHRSMERPGYRLYSFVWVKLFVFRKYYIWLRRRIGRLYSRLISGGKK